MIFFLLIGVLLGGVSVIFVLQNIVPITVTFMYWHIEGSLAIILFLAMMSGVLVALCLLLPGLIRDEMRYSKLSFAKKKVEEELATTRKVINKVAGNAVVVEQAPAVL